MYSLFQPILGSRKYICCFLKWCSRTILLTSKGWIKWQMGSTPQDFHLAHFLHAWRLWPQGNFALSDFTLVPHPCSHLQFYTRTKKQTNKTKTNTHKKQKQDKNKNKTKQKAKQIFKACKVQTNNKQTNKQKHLFSHVILMWLIMKLWTHAWAGWLVK